MPSMAVVLCMIDPRIPTKCRGGARPVFTNRQTLITPSPKRRKVLGESREG